MFDFLYNIFGFLFRILMQFVSDYGLALVIFTVFFRLVLLPTSIKQQKSSAKTVRMQPKLRRIREKYQDYSPQERNMKIQQETNELYQREGYSAMTGGCAPLLLQMPILWGLYGIIRKPLTYVLALPEDVITAVTEAVTKLGLAGQKTVAYAETIAISKIDEIAKGVPELMTKYGEEIAKIQDFNFSIFGIDLGLVPSEIYDTLKLSAEALPILAVPVLSGLTSLMTSVLTQARQKKANPNMENQQMMGCMMLWMPLMSLWFTWNFPVGMGMYWILSNLLAFLQTLILGNIYAPRKTIAKLMVEETIYRRSYEDNRKAVKAKGSIEE